MSPIPAVAHFRNHWTNSEGYALTRMCSRNHARFPILFWDVCLRELLTGRRCASDACGRAPQEIYRRSKRYVSNSAFFHSQALMDPTDVPPGDCGLETQPSKNRPPHGRYYRSTPTDLRSHAGWGPARVHLEPPGHGQDKSCKCYFWFVV